MEKVTRWELARYTHGALTNDLNVCVIKMLPIKEHDQVEREIKFKAFLSPQPVLGPPVTGPFYHDINHFQYCTAHFLPSPLISDTPM